jgi:hypothetical protein
MVMMMTLAHVFYHDRHQWEGTAKHNSSACKQHYGLGLMINSGYQEMGAIAPVP